MDFLSSEIDLAKHLWPFVVGFVAITLWGGTPPATQVAVAGIDALSVGMLRTRKGAAALAGDRSRAVPRAGG